MPRSVVRALQILDILGPSEDGLTHAQITKTLGIPKSSVSPILRDLISHDFISFDQTTKQYTLGPKITSLAHNYLDGLDLIKIGGPVVKELARMTGESVALYIRSNTESQLVYKQDSPQTVLRLLKVGARAPLYAIAAGKVLLAHMPQKEIEHYLSSSDRKPFTRHTITDPDKLRQQLDEIRAGAFGYNHEEFEEGVIGVAAPVYDGNGKVVAALSVVAPSFRVNRQRMEDTESVLHEKSADFSHRLGFERDFKNRNSTSSHKHKKVG